METKMTDRTGRSLIDFLERAGEKGWVNKNTAANYRAACQKVLEIESDWEAVDIAAIDLDELFHRFQNLRGGEYSPNSLETYRSRLRKAVEIYLGWSEDPSSWKPPNSSRRGPSQGTPVSPRTDSPERIPISGRDTTDQEMKQGMIQYPFPLRDKLLAQLVLPRDLTSQEAARLVAFVNALAIADKPREED